MKTQTKRNIAASPQGTIATHMARGTTYAIVQDLLLTHGLFGALMVNGNIAKKVDLSKIFYRVDVDPSYGNKILKPKTPHNQRESRYT